MVRYRILVDRGSRDGDAMIVPVIVSGEVWWCSCCGEDNDDDSLFCGFCKNERGDYICEDCGHKNKRTSDECEECGRDRPDE